ncbi:two component transcriptional regulator, LytTR family [Caloranaerobacter azorensis DSM 13643]|uniref:Two component transcriptional regulator, LytTR family n=1 Tax=Caloranaerobacter azorensis DSM 13643 TaxID=1121264 RepID=A0A1M5URY5_9FIRM|nr:LytTR family transcriptional regulator DNA-binding domain-containing protein [Caloranaerobacter azorensis]SHH65685.1 two component transcriptional regulator, LytTR family [Caloranaerobacter azorensis DSM 13643]
MIRCIIVDDEMPAREEIKYLLQQFDDIDIVGEAAHGLEAIELIQKLKPDLIFLDIKMPKISGIEVAEHVIKDEYVPLIVFITAFDQFAIKAFDVNAIDYLLKPISKERLKKTIDKIKEIYYSRIDYNDRLEKFLKYIKDEERNKINKISVYKNGKLIPLNLNEIIYITVEGRTTVIVSTKGRFESNNTLSQLERKLNTKNFFRSHRSFLINIDYIEEIEPWFNSTYQIKMKYSKEKIPVSRSQVKEFREIMNIN